MNITQEQPQTKFCTRCKKDKPISGFSKNTRNKDCKDHKCQTCRKASYPKEKVKEGFYDVDKDYGFLNQMDASIARPRIPIREPFKVPTRK